MQVPEFHDGLAPGTADARVRVQEISEYFRYVEATTPRLRKQRIRAIIHLRENGWSAQMIADETGMKLHRINDVIKEERKRRVTPMPSGNGEILD